uniref:Uncharacterized protein n=1 Tax=Acrobeloides nanus TaxID=290746 RepID=A0A914E438_9BILA
MKEELYARVIRALLHSEVPEKRSVRCRTYELIERLKQAAQVDDEVHSRILAENERHIGCWIRGSIESPTSRKFLLQIGGSEDRSTLTKEHLVSTNDTFFLSVSETRSSTLRIYPFEEGSQTSSTLSIPSEKEKEPCNKSPNLQRSTSFLRRWVRTQGPVKIKSLTFNHGYDTPISNDLKTIFKYSMTRKHPIGKGNGEMELDDIVSLIDHLFQYKFEENEEDQTKWNLSNEILKRVAKFYDIPSINIKLLLIGVALTHKMTEGNPVVTMHFIRSYLPTLQSAFLDKTPSALASAIFLSKCACTYTRAVIETHKFEVFLPIAIEPNSLDFLKLGRQLEPISEIYRLPFWEDPQLKHFTIQITKSFEEAIQKSIIKWLEFVTNSSTDPDELCENVDELHVALRRCLTTYEPFFAHFGIYYMEFVLRMVDEPLVNVTKTCLASSTQLLNTRDQPVLIEFTKSSMKLFDAFRLLKEFVAEIKTHEYAFYDFESWFEEAAIFWTTTWRQVYLDFVQRSVISGERRDSVIGSGVVDSSTFDTAGNEPKLHESSVMTLAFCKSLCDDFLRLTVQNTSILTLCCTKIVSILAECMVSFSIQIRAQFETDSTLQKLAKAANGIDHASNHLAQNYARFLDLRRLETILPEEESRLALSTMSRLMSNAHQRCQLIADEMVTTICVQKKTSIEKYCQYLTQVNGPPKKTIKAYMKHVFAQEKAEQLFNTVDKINSHLKYALLPRLLSIARNKLWEIIQDALQSQLLLGQPPSYYHQIQRDCETICRMLSLDWNQEESPFRRKIHMNSIETREQILQYYARLADLTLNAQLNPQAGIPKVSLRLGPSDELFTLISE